MMVSEKHLACSRVIIPPEGIQQDFPLGGNITNSTILLKD